MTPEFKTKVTIDGDFEGDCEIKWSAEFEMRSWGIKDVVPMALPQRVAFYDESYREDSEGNPIDGNYVDIELASIECRCQVEYQISLYPESLTIEKVGSEYRGYLYF